MTDVDLAAAVADVLDDVQLLVHRKDLRVDVRLPEDTPPEELMTRMYWPIK